MKYRNPLYKRKKNSYALEVSCAYCKTSMAIYAKAGRGNLIKMQVPRIIESEVDLKNIKGQLLCINCKEELAKTGTYNGNIALWVVRGKINTKRLNNY